MSTNGQEDEEKKEETTTAIKTENVEHTEDYQKLIEYGIDEQVANELDTIYKDGESTNVYWNENTLHFVENYMFVHVFPSIHEP